MKEFVLFFRLKNPQPIAATPDLLHARTAWLAALQAQNSLVDSGHTLAAFPAKIVTAVGTSTDLITVGAECLSGYLVIRAIAVEEAVVLAQSNPIFSLGGSIEVREIAQRPSSSQKPLDS
ncbi:YciI family protein [Flavobacterium sp. JP2137]|uniref:YciI family protein n=1 Tax=Flavobacterium sp. JP2137 TaxID=3414510 RepID=UPI003D2FCB0E